MQQPISSPLSPGEVTRFRKKLAAWYQTHARVLPWRNIEEPYQTWVSEIMLQQTRVNAVLDHYTRFLARFPTIVSLALAPESDVLALWSGLGYYRRARMLHKAAQFLVREHRAALPTTSTELRTLPGVGEYTSAAIASIAFGEQIAVVDGNVERVLLRITARDESTSKSGREFIHQQAQALVPRRTPGDHNQAMMELGATICLPRSPLCLECPVYSICRTRGEHLTLPRSKMRSQHIAFALSLRKNGLVTEVLLQRRGDQLTLMPGMLELPQISLEQYPNQQPILRVRHSITTTNYYVEVYGIGGSLESVAPTRSETNALHSLHIDDFEHSAANRIELVSKPKTALTQSAITPHEEFEEDSVVEASFDHEKRSDRTPLIPSIGSGSTEDALRWVRCSTLATHPLTGLTRKILRRLDVMTSPIPTPKRKLQQDQPLLTPPTAPAPPAQRPQPTRRKAPTLFFE